MTLFAAIKHWATTSPERIALNNGEQQLTYRQLNEKINNLAQLLTQQSITRLALQLDNSIEWALVDLACLKAGIIIIPMPLFFSQEQQTWLLENSGADALIGAERSGWEATPIGRLPLYRYQPQQVPTVPAGTAKITYTSGTTGQPKAFGRNFSPEWIETEAMLYSAISHLVVFGDGLPVNVALVHPVPGKEKDLSTQIDTLNEKLPDYARIHHFIVTNLSNSALMTSNGRLCRAAIYLRFQEQIQRAIQE